MNYLRFVVSVSSSDRRGVQENRISSLPCWQTGFSILIGSSGGSSSSPSPPPALSGSFSILIGSSGGSSWTANTSTRRCMWCFSILIGSSGGSRMSAPRPRSGLRACFSILIGSSGGSSPRWQLEQRSERCFSILIGSSGGSSVDPPYLTSTRSKFQYPHRIVGGFK